MTEEQPKPAGFRFLGVARAILGIMWFLQTLWKLPPKYGAPRGLLEWVTKSGEYGLFGFYRSFIHQIFLPHFSFFGLQVWAAETFIAVGLVFGIFGRFAGLLSGLMGINLYIALSRAPGEWPWSYVFVALFGFLFFFTRAGRYWGVDAILAPKLERRAAEGSKIAAIAAWLT